MSVPADHTSVYLYYDKRGVLLYVGITKRNIARNDEHSVKEWWPFVAEQKIEHHPSREVALARETMLIREHRPPFNRQQNPDYLRLRDAYLALFAWNREVTGQVERCGHCDGCRELDQLPDSPCRLLMDWGGADPMTCSICGRADCHYEVGYLAGEIHGAVEGHEYGVDQGRREVRNELNDIEMAHLCLTFVVDHSAKRPGDGPVMTGPFDPVAWTSRTDAVIRREGLSSLVRAARVASDPWASPSVALETVG